MDQSFSSNNVPSNPSEIMYDEQRATSLNPFQIRKEIEENNVKISNNERNQVNPVVNIVETNISKQDDIIGTRDKTREQEKKEKSLIDLQSNIKEIKTESFNPAKSENTNNLYEEIGKDFNETKAIDDRETKFVTENLKEKLNSRYVSPRNDTRSNYTKSRMRIYSNVTESKEQSISSVRDRYKTFYESKTTLETSLELSKKKCEIYEKEITSLRHLVNDLKLQISRTNEEAHKLEISRLKQNFVLKEKENQILIKENNSLKKQIKKYEDNTSQLMEDNKAFRLEAEKKFCQYNREIENLTEKLNDFNHKKAYEQEIEEDNDRRLNEFINREKNYTKTETNNLYIEDYNNTVTKEAAKLEEYDERNFVNNLYNAGNFENYDHNNFTNGSPNIIEEVGADNYLKMNGNTYDEMKDVRFEDDNLQDHQYYDNTVSLPITSNNQNHAQPVFNDLATEIEDFTKSANTGDNFNKSNVFAENKVDSKKAESGATNNLFFSILMYLMI